MAPRRRFNLVRFARALDDHRHAQRLHWIQVAEQTGVPQSTLSRIASVSRRGEVGEVNLPSLENALSLATWLGTPLEGFWEVAE